MLFFYFFALVTLCLVVVTGLRREAAIVGSNKARLQGIDTILVCHLLVWFVSFFACCFALQSLMPLGILVAYLIYALGLGTTQAREV